MRLLVLALISTTACGGHQFKPGEAHDISGSAIAVGARAPAGELMDASGKTVALDRVIGGHDRTIVTFYRGFY